MILLILIKIQALKRIRKYKELFFDKEIEVLDIMDHGIVDNTNDIYCSKRSFFCYG